MKEAVIVSAARTPIGKAYRGAYNQITGASLGAIPVAEAVCRAGIEPGEVEDCLMGCGLPQGATGGNIARQIALRAGLPVTVAGITMDRQCSSGLMAIATAAKQVIHDGQSIAVAGGIESISLVQNDHMNTYCASDQALLRIAPAIYMPMLDTAEVVAKRYQISREAQDEYALQSQQRAARAIAEGRFAGQIVPVELKTRKGVQLFEVDEHVRGDVSLEQLAAMKTAFKQGGTVTAGNASGLNDGAAALLLAARRG